MRLRDGSFSQFLKICLHFSAVCLQFFKKKLPPLKHILALPTWGQKSLISELQPFEKGNFDLGHPVDHFDEIFYLLWPNFINVMFVQQKKITFAKYSFHGTDSR